MPDSIQLGNTNLPDEELRKRRLHAHVNQEGGNPSLLLEILCLVLECEDWKEMEDAKGRPLSFLEYITSPYPVGINWTKEEFLAVLKLPHRHERPTSYFKEIATRIGRCDARCGPSWESSGNRGPSPINTNQPSCSTRKTPRISMAKSSWKMNSMSSPKATEDLIRRLLDESLRKSR